MPNKRICVHKVNEKIIPILESNEWIIYTSHSSEINVQKKYEEHSRPSHVKNPKNFLNVIIHAKGILVCSLYFQHDLEIILACKKSMT